MAPTPPNKLPKPNFEGMPDGFIAHYSQAIDALNSVMGHSGEIALANHLSLGGNRIMNVGAPAEESDAISSGVAQSKYSVQALGPLLESSQPTGLKSMRRLNDTNQREQSSSFMNDLMSAVPNSNQIFPLISNSGGNVQVIIPASLFTWADGSTIQLISRTDLLPIPAQYTILTISSVGNLVTVVLTSGSPLVAGQAITVAGVTPSSFNGTFGIVSSTGGGSTLTYQLDLGTLSGAGGTVQANGVWYYAVQKRDPTVHLLGPFPSDTMQNRLQASFDHFQIVAVVVITNSGGQISQSGGGGSPIVGSPTAGSFFVWFFIIMSLASITASSLR